jgi:hypothetical protein
MAHKPFYLYKRSSTKKISSSITYNSMMMMVTGSQHEALDKTLKQQLKHGLMNNLKKG